MTLEDVLDSALEDMRERIEDGEDEDCIAEIADNHTPVYNWDILNLASENNFLATNEPELGPAFDGKATPINIIAANIYEAISNHLYANYEDVKTEVEEKNAEKEKED